MSIFSKQLHQVHASTLHICMALLVPCDSINVLATTHQALSLPPPSHASPAASSDEQLLIADEVAQHKSNINSLQLQLFSSALSQIEAEVTSPEFAAAFAAAGSGTGIESFRTMNDMPLDAQVPSAASFTDNISLLIPPSFRPTAPRLPAPPASDPSAVFSPKYSRPSTRR
jgi:hypothetical protein